MHPSGGKAAKGQLACQAGPPVCQAGPRPLYAPEATLKQQLEVVEGSPDLQGEVKALRAQLLEEQDHSCYQIPEPCCHSFASLQTSRDLLQSEVNALQSDLSTVVSGRLHTQLATEAAQKEEAKASSVMDLELADYRRSVEQLRNQLSDRDSKIEAAKREKEEYQKTLEQLKKDGDSEAEKLQAGGELKEDQLCCQDQEQGTGGCQETGELQATIVQVQTELETQRQLAEGAKVEFADLTARLLSTQQCYSLQIFNPYWYTYCLHA
eukprot:Em0013g620a